MVNFFCPETGCEVEMKLRIFVIDDEECVTETFKWHLSDKGHEVICSPEPTSCKVYQGDQCDHEHPCGDIMFVDKHMPKMSGLEFIEHMKKKGCKGAAQNKVVMSGAMEHSDVQKALGLGCSVAYKPITFAQIDALVEKMKKNIPPGRKLADLPG
jgi:CheY-like chemotaxis protein